MAIPSHVGVRGVDGGLEVLAAEIVDHLERTRFSVN
jgi:hypothetical protein